VPIKFLKKWLPQPEQMRKHKSLQFLGKLLHDPNIFHLNRRSVSGAFAAGLFIAFMPIPGQMPLAALVAILLRVNLPIAVSLTWVTNPFTMAPLFFLSYKTGAFITGSKLQHLKPELSFDWLFREFGTNLLPFLVGCLVLGAIAALVSFVTIRLVWRLHLLQRIKERRLLHLSRKQPDEK
jgi:uncharacterized protein (DUF2062 family)